MKIKLLFLIAFLNFYSSAHAQDPIFTQYFMVPETLNPGFTGFLETTSVGVLHRTQWPDLNFRVDTEFAFLNTWLEEANSGIGISVLNHREKFTDYNFTQVNANYAYRVKLTDEWYFRPAIEIGIGNKSFGFQNVILGDQLNLGQGTINQSSVDPLQLKEKVNFFDFSAGMLFNNENAWFGASLKHINKPNITFAVNGNIPLDVFVSANAGYELLISDYSISSFLPNDTKLLMTANFMKQGDYNRLDIGSGLIFKKLFFGATAAINPVRNSPNSHVLTSINAFGGLHYDHFKFGYSYDFNTSKIGRTGGIYELSLIYRFELIEKCISCPNYY